MQVVQDKAQWSIFEKMLVTFCSLKKDKKFLDRLTECHILSKDYAP
jgi:hypothetical protein